MAVVEEWRLGSGEYVGEISALCLLTDPHRLSSLPYLIAGTLSLRPLLALSRSDFLTPA